MMMIRGRNFALLELLVVIAVLAILAAFLLPLLQKGVNESRKASCLNQQRQIGTGVLAYSDDHRGWMPDYSLNNYTPNTVWNNRNFYTSFIGQPVGLGDVLVNGYLGPDGRGLPFRTYATPPAEVNAFWRANADIFRCPSMSIRPGPVAVGEVYTSSGLGAFASSDYVISGTGRARLRYYFEMSPIYKLVYYTPQTALWANSKARRTLYTACFFNAESYPNNPVPHGGDAPCWILDGSAKVLPRLFNGELQAMFWGSAYRNAALRNDSTPFTSAWFYFAQYYYENNKIF